MWSVCAFVSAADVKNGMLTTTLVQCLCGDTNANIWGDWAPLHGVDCFL